MSLADFSLEGKKALVVGARRNVGKDFALGLAIEALLYLGTLFFWILIITSLVPISALGHDDSP